MNAGLKIIFILKIFKILLFLKLIFYSQFLLITDECYLRH